MSAPMTQEEIKTVVDNADKSIKQVCGMLASHMVMMQSHFDMIDCLQAIAYGQKPNGAALKAEELRDIARLMLQKLEQ